VKTWRAIASNAIRLARAPFKEEATMPWKQGYTISDERSLPASAVRWPDGARCCVAITVDMSVASRPEGVTAADLTTPEALFGANQGLAALREVLRRHAMRVTFAVPAAIAHIHRDLVRSLTADGHEIAAHGFRHEDVSGLERNEERRRIVRTTEVLADITGSKPAGWFSLPRQGDRYAVGAVSPNTVDLLIEAGFRYLRNGLADDIPHYWVSDFASGRALLTLPYYYHFDDQFFLMFPRKGTGLEHPDALLRNWRGEFAAQYRRGRYFHMTLHPQHIGWSNRLQMLDEFLAEVRGYPGLWNPTAAECARYWLETYPASAHLRLAPSIWQDYPGSLS
jgi:peptidoglycan/xylan/chitin deacetylase (PgdA/CDA1 family)